MPSPFIWPADTSSSDHRNDPKRTLNAIVLGNRHIGAGYQLVAVELEEWFVVVPPLWIVVEAPAAPGMPQSSPALGLVAPEACHHAFVRFLAPQFGRQAAIA